MLQAIDKYRWDIIFLLVLFAFGVLINLHYGRMGYHPLDHSILFDGGWRLLSGQLPFRDFVAPNGFVAMGIQAGFFQLLGVTWFAYCLHAALFNGLFCLLVYGFLRFLKGNPLLALFYGLLSGIVFYPPIGVPFLEQHAYFFLLFAILMAVIANQVSTPALSNALWATMPLVITLAYFSKQIPTVFGIPIILVLLMTLGKNRLLKASMFFLLGALLTLIALLGLIKLLGLDTHLIQYYYFEIMTAEAAKRTTFLVSLPLAIFRWNLASVYFMLASATGMFALYISSRYPRWRLLAPLVLGGIAGETVLIFGILMVLLYAPNMAAYFPGNPFLTENHGRYPLELITHALINLLLGLLLANVFLQSITRVMNRSTENQLALSKNALRLLLAMGLIWVCFATATLTANQAAIEIPYVFLSLGLLHITMIHFLKSKVNTILQWLPKPMAPSHALGCLLILLGLYDAVQFNQGVNIVRGINDYYHPPNIRITQEPLPHALRFMQWGIPDFYHYTATDFTRLAQFLQNAPENFLFIGDSAILYGITGKPSVTPSLFFYGAAIPGRNTKTSLHYQDWLLRNIQHYRVRYVVLEGERTWLGYNLAYFERVNTMVQKNTCAIQSFGSFKVIELCRFAPES